MLLAPSATPAAATAAAATTAQRGVAEEEDEDEDGMPLPLAHDAPLRMIKDFVEREGLAVSTNVSRTRNREDAYGDAIVAWTIQVDAHGQQAGGAP